MKTEAEQLLYYSVPGFFIFFFVFLFLVMMGITNILDIRVITFIVAAVIPIGFVTYQGYIRTLYRKIWKEWYRVLDPYYQFFERYLSQNLKIIDETLAKDVKETMPPTHILLFHMHGKCSTETVDYSWRLVNLINARGVGIFSCILAIFVPLIYGLYLYVSSPNFPVFPNFGSLTSNHVIVLLAYYALIGIFAYVLASGVSGIKENLADLNTGILVSERSDLEQLIKAFSATKTVCFVNDILSKEKKRIGISQELIEKSFKNLENKDWEKALQNASEAYKNMKQNNNSLPFARRAQDPVP